MIDKLELKFGSSIGQPNLRIDITPITIFVGPNNSGKSKVLIEIEDYCRNTKGKLNNVLLGKIEFIPYEKNDIERELSEIQQIPTPSENVPANFIIIGKVSAQHNTAKRIMIERDAMITEALNPNAALFHYRKFLDLYTLRLDGINRLKLLDEQPIGDLQKAPENHLSNLFQNNILRKEVRRVIYDALGKYYVIDPTNVGKLRVRLSDREPKSEAEEKNWDSDSVTFHSAATGIINASDGVKAFTGIITTLLAGNPKITLIDEPEAFLHPALSNKLGKEIGTSLRNTKKRLFASTHSSNFLMGCIQSGAPLNIVRLTYKNEVATGRILPQEKILHLMRHPLLRSTGILNGLFYEAVVVCEADTDRAFYQEINERLLARTDKRGINNCLFINAQNKQTVWEIVKPLRELGIPTVGIVDIDVIKDGGKVFNKPLSGAFVPTLSHEPLQNQRAAILKLFNENKKNMKTQGGVNLLTGNDKEACDNFFNQLREYGIFVIKNGELESWLKPLGATSHGTSWLLNIFEKMGENPDDINYIIPSTGDVWDFIGEMKLWMDNPLRKGIPK